MDTGKVLFCEDGLAIVSDLNNDAEVGTKLVFDSGATGALLWRRDDNLVYVSVLEGPEKVTVGEGVRCSVQGVLQLVDETTGPVTRRDYEVVKVPTGPAIKGQVVDYLGRPRGSTTMLGGPMVPLFNRSPDMESREPINAGHITGNKFIDALTPIGKGQSLLITGLAGAGKTAAVLDIIAGQRDANIRCVYACLGQDESGAEAARQYLVSQGAMTNTTIVTASKDAPLAERYSALCAALSIAEHERDNGGDAIVVLDDVRCMVDVWDKITGALTILGPKYLAMKGKEVEGLAGATVAAAKVKEEDLSEEELVEYEGMLVSVSAAQRRRFFSSVIQRAAKLHRRLGGGTLTLLPVLAGSPATGSAQGQKARAAILQSKTLSEQQKLRMLAALDEKEKAEGLPGAVSSDTVVATEVIEEFMSMTDGQAVFERHPGNASGSETFGPLLNANASVSRIGTRAYAKVMEPLAATLRFVLSQARDASRFNTVLSDPVSQLEQQRSARLQWTLQQRRGEIFSAAQQVVHLLAFQKGKLDGCSSAAEADATLKQLADRILADQALATALTTCATPEEVEQALAGVLNKLA